MPIYECQFESQFSDDAGSPELEDSGDRSTEDRLRDVFAQHREELKEQEMTQT